MIDYIIDVLDYLFPFVRIIVIALGVLVGGVMALGVLGALLYIFAYL